MRMKEDKRMIKFFSKIIQIKLMEFITRNKARFLINKKNN